MAPLDNNNFAALPRWALVAFIGRCASRLLPLYERNDAEPADQRIAVTRAISLAERRAAMGGDPDDYDVVALATDGQFVDNYDIDALKSALAGALQAATNAYSDLGGDEGKIPSSDMSIGQHTGVILAVTSLAGSSLDAAFGKGLNQKGPDLPELSMQAVNESLFADKVLESHVLRDFEALQRWDRRRSGG